MNLSSLLQQVSENVQQQHDQICMEWEDDRGRLLRYISSLEKFNHSLKQNLKIINKQYDDIIAKIIPPSQRSKSSNSSITSSSSNNNKKRAYHSVEVAATNAIHTGNHNINKHEINSSHMNEGFVHIDYQGINSTRTRSSTTNNNNNNNNIHLSVEIPQVHVRKPSLSTRQSSSSSSSSSSNLILIPDINNENNNNSNNSNDINHHEVLIPLSSSLITHNDDRRRDRDGDIDSVGVITNATKTSKKRKNLIQIDGKADAHDDDDDERDLVCVFPGILYSTINPSSSSSSSSKTRVTNHHGHGAVVAGDSQMDVDNHVNQLSSTRLSSHLSKPSSSSSSNHHTAQPPVSPSPPQLWKRLCKSSNNNNNNNNSNSKSSGDNNNNSKNNSKSSGDDNNNSNNNNNNSNIQSNSNNNNNNNNNTNKNKNNTTIAATSHMESAKSVKCVETVRQKSLRDILPGHTCNECHRYYEALQQQGVTLDEYTMKDMLKECSRHKAQWSPPHTPAGFWDVSVNTPADWK